MSEYMIIKDRKLKVQLTADKDIYKLVVGGVEYLNTSASFERYLVSQYYGMGDKHVVLKHVREWYPKPINTNTQEKILGAFIDSHETEEIADTPCVLDTPLYSTTHTPNKVSTYWGEVLLPRGAEEDLIDIIANSRHTQEDMVSYLNTYKEKYGIYMKDCNGNVTLVCEDDRIAEIAHQFLVQHGFNPKLQTQIPPSKRNTAFVLETILGVLGMDIITVVVQASFGFYIPSGKGFYVVPLAAAFLSVVVMPSYMLYTSIADKEGRRSPLRGCAAASLWCVVTNFIFAIIFIYIQ